MPGKTPVWFIHAGAVYLRMTPRTGGHMVFPDERVAVVVLTNQDSVDTSAAIARSIAPLLFMHDDASKEEQQSRAVFEGLQQGKITHVSTAMWPSRFLWSFASPHLPLGNPLIDRVQRKMPVVWRQPSHGGDFQQISDRG